MARTQAFVRGFYMPQKTMNDVECDISVPISDEYIKEKYILYKP